MPTKDELLFQLKHLESLINNVLERLPENLTEGHEDVEVMQIQLCEIIDHVEAA